MGYTHYWTGTAPQRTEELESRLSLILDEAEARGIALGDWSGDTGTNPTLSIEEISFNGVDADSGETFRITFGEDTSGFCKTGQRDYDPVVVAVLELLTWQSQRDGGDFSWSSDGRREDHEKGIRLSETAKSAVFV